MLKARLWTVSVKVAIAVLLCATLTARTEAQNPPSTQADELRHDCDTLLATAVRRTYGIAWEHVRREVIEKRVAQRSVSMQPRDTPAAGVLLLYAGKLLNEPRYLQAAVDAARGVAAAQQDNGQIPETPLFGKTAGGHDEPLMVPDRGPTRAGLALLIAVLTETDLPPSQKELIKGAAARCTQWLVKQQTKTGAFVAAYPPTTAPKDMQRILRLDDADFRDSTYSLLLGSDVLQSKTASDGVHKAVTLLISYRLATPEKSRGLWPTASTLTGESIKHGEFVRGADALSTRYAMETLFAAVLMTDDADAAGVLDDTYASLLRIRRADTMWDRHVEAPDPQTGPGIFGEPTSQPSLQEQTIASFGLDELIIATDQLKLSGREQLRMRLEQTCAMRRRLIFAICGLSDAPIARESIAPVLPIAPKR
jgi:hypothetical protein